MACNAGLAVGTARVVFTRITTGGGVTDAGAQTVVVRCADIGLCALGGIALTGLCSLAVLSI